MNQIKVGTCIPGDVIFDWGPPLIRAGFECISINFHMQCNQPDLKAFAAKVAAMLEGSGVCVSTLGFYCNPLESEEQRRQLEAFIDRARDFGADTVATFGGALAGQSVEAAMPVFKKVFGELAKRAEANGVKLVLENCPMGGDWHRTTCNIAFNPAAWEMIFNAVPSDALGLEWEPTHQMYQLIDPVAQLRKWVSKVYHVHGKDATLDRSGLAEHGFMSDRPFVWSRTPGFGDTDWRDIFFILHRHNYAGTLCVEGYHDDIYRRDWEMTGQLHALHYLKWCRGGDFTPNPWG